MTQPAPRRRGQTLKLLVGVGIAAVFVWLIVRSVDGAALAAALAAARPGWIVAAIVLFACGYACRIWRWRLMLARDNPGIDWATCAVPFMASIAGNNVLPFRAGDALRVFAFTGWLKVGPSPVLATLLVERLLDLLTLLLALGLALMLFDVAGDGRSLVGLGAWGLLALGVAVAGVLLVPQIFEPFARLAARLVRRLSNRIGLKLEAEVVHVFATLRHLAHGPRMAFLLMWSLVAWSFEGAVFYAAARALPSITEPLAGWLALPVGTLATLIPSTPGYVGTFDFFVIKAAEAMGNPVAAAAAFAILVHLILWLPATLVGGACFAAWAVRRGPPARVADAERTPSP